jgi:hypothetical protein
VVLAVFLAVPWFVAAAQVVISNVPVPAPAPVTFDQVKVFVYVTLGGVLLSVLVVSGGVLAFILNRDHAHAVLADAASAAAIAADRATQEKQFAVIGRAVESVGAAVRGLTEAQERHDEYPFAHSAAIHAVYDPMLKEIREMGTTLAELRTEYNVIHRNEDAISTLLQKRDPALSPHPRRSTDAVDYDGRPLRGRQ